MEDKTYDISATAPKVETEYNIGIDTDPVLNEGALLNRAFRYHMSLGDSSPGAQSIITDLQSGQESKYQQMLQSQEMAARDKAAKGLVTEYVQNDAAPEPATAVSLANTGTPPNKDTVLEEVWGKKAFDAIANAETGGEISKAMADNPPGFDASLQPYEKKIWKDLVIRKWKDRSDTTIKNMGYAPYIFGYGMQLLQAPTMANIIRNPEGGAVSSSYLTAEALAQKVEHVLSLDPPEMNDAIRAEYEALAYVNPLDGQKFVDALVSYSASDYDFNIVDDLSLIPGGAIAKAGQKGLKIITAAGKAGKIAEVAVKSSAEVAQASKALRAGRVAGGAEKAAAAAPKAAREELGVVIDGKMVKASEATPEDIAKVEKMNAEDPGRNSSRSAAREDINYREAWISQAQEPKAAGAKEAKPLTDSENYLDTWNNLGPNQKDWKSVTGLGKEFFSEVLAANGSDLGKAAQAVKAEISKALERGDRVRLNYDGKAVEIVRSEDGRLYDAKGQQWGLQNQFQSADGKDLLQFISSGAKEPLVKEIEDTARAVSAAHADIPTALSGTGKPKAAIDHTLRFKYATEILGDKTPGAIRREFANNLAKTPNFFSPTVSVNVGDGFYKTQLFDHEAVLDRFKKAYLEIANLQKVNRNPEEALNLAFKQKEEVMKYYYQRIDDKLLSVERVLPGENGLHVGILKYRWGESNSELFKSYKDALQFTRANGIKNPYFDQSGGKWFVETYAYVGEDRIAEKALTADNIAVNGDAWVHVRRHLGSIMQASPFQSMQRMTAVAGEGKMGEIIKELYEPLNKLSGKEKEALNEIMVMNQLSEAVPGDPTTRGKFFRDFTELDDAYFQRFKRHPTANEVAAYDTMVRNSNLMWQFLTWGEARRKIIPGHETIEVTRMIEGGDMAKTVYEGRILKPEEFPLEKGHNVDALVIDDKGIVERLNLSKLTPDDKTRLRKMLNEDGYKAVQSFNSRDPALQRLGGSESALTFVVTKNIKNSPIRLDRQVAYRPGFTNEYKHEWYIKQPRVKDGRYEGDTVFMGVNVRAQGEKLGKLLDKARELYHAKSTAEFEKFVRENNFPFTPEKLSKLFDEHFDTSVPFALVRNNTKASELGFLNGKPLNSHPGFENLDTTLDDLYNPSATFGSPYVTARDPLLFSVKELVGSEDKPIWELADPELTSPMLTQTKAMKNLVRSEFYNDYQLTSAQQWIEEFADVIRREDRSFVSPDDLRRNPIHFLANSTLVGDPRRVAQATQLKNSIVSLLGEPSELARGIDSFLQKSIDFTYNQFGQKYVEYIPTTALPMVTHPDSYLRGVTFQLKMGLLNPVQFFKQAASVLTSSAAHPVHAMQSVPANFGFSLAHFTEHLPNIMKIDEVVSKTSLGVWKPGMFEESLRMYRKTAYDNLGSNAFKNDMGDPKVVTGGMGHKILEFGTLFFNGGERVNRMVGWNIAYLKYVTDNPKKIGKLTEFDAQKIHKYAQALTGNMTRDANAWYQNNSWTTLFTQFQAYPMRMLETVVGHELPVGARLRMGVGQLFLWGAPPVAGMSYMAQNGMGYNPFTEHLHTYAAEHGIDLSGTDVDMVHRGVVSMFMEYLTGEKLDFSGYGVNVPFVQSIDNFNKVNEDNGTLAAIFSTAMGATGSTTNNMFNSWSTVFGDVKDMILQDGAHGEMLPEDFHNALKEVSSLNAWEKMVAAGNGAAYRNRNGSVMATGEDPLVDFTKAILGVDNIDKTFTFNALEDSKRGMKLKEKMKDRLKIYSGYMWDAEQRGDWEASKRYQKAIVASGVAGGLSSEEIRHLVFAQGEKNEVIEKVLMKGILERMQKGSEERENFAKEIERRFTN